MSIRAKLAIGFLVPLAGIILLIEIAVLISKLYCLYKELKENKERRVIMTKSNQAKLFYRIVKVCKYDLTIDEIKGAKKSEDRLNLVASKFNEKELKRYAKIGQATILFYDIEYIVNTIFEQRIKEEKDRIRQLAKQAK